MASVSQAIFELCPGASWSLIDEDYEQLNWKSSDIVKPSREEVAAHLLAIERREAAAAYQRQRQPEYPPISDLADALYWSNQGDNTKLDEYYAACAAVKAKYPKDD